MRLHHASDPPPRGSKPLAALLAHLNNKPAFGRFHGTLQFFGGFGIVFSPQALAAWLVKRSRATSPTIAVKNLGRYLRAASLSARRVTVLDSLILDRVYQIAPHLTLEPWDRLDQSEMKQAMLRQFLSSSFLYMPTAALVRRERLPIIHVRQDASPPSLEGPSTTLIDDAVLILGLVSHSAPKALANWLESPAWAPVHGGGFGMSFMDGFGSRTTFTPELAAATRNLLKRLRLLTGDDGARIRLILSRLQASRRKHSLVDQAIDLGIALEALFLSEAGEDKNELSFRLRLRASRYLRDTPSSRNDLFSILTKIYDVRSQAVHTGRLRTKKGAPDPAPLIGAGQSIVAEAVVRILKKGYPDWRTVALS